MMNRIPKLMGVALVALLAASGLAGCGSATASSSTAATLQPVDDALAVKAQTSCWFKVKNRTSKADEVRLWNASSSAGAKTERLGELLIVSGAMEPAVHDDKYYACSLFEYTPGSPVVMVAKSSTMPSTTDSVVPYGFSKDGRKEIK